MSIPRHLLLLHALMTSVLVVGCAVEGASTSAPVPTVAPATSVIQTASPTVAPTPPRTSRASWAPQTASAADVTARLRSAGLNVEPQPPTTVALFGAERLDLFLIQGERTAIYTFANAAASARVLDDAANSRLTVSYLRTPYYVQVANLLVVITTNDPKVAAEPIRVLTGP